MKSIVAPVLVPNPTFKKGTIVTANGHTVLVTGEGATSKTFAGVAIGSDFTSDLSRYSSEWNREVFSHFQGTVTLQND